MQNVARSKGLHRFSMLMFALAAGTAGVLRAEEYAAPSPVYGYYEEGGLDALSWLTGDLTVFTENGLTLFLGIGDADIGDPRLLAFLQEAQRQGVEVRAWMLLPFEEGYWPNEYNAELFAESVRRAVTWFRSEGLPIEWIVVDMELGYQKLMDLQAMALAGEYEAMVAALLGNLDRSHFVRASVIFQDLVDELHDRGFRVMVVTYPQVADDLADWDCSLQDLLDIPVSTVTWDEVSLMVYTSIYNDVGAYLGVTFGPGLVYSYARSTMDWVGPSYASIALGVAGDMAGADELAAEVAAAKAAGIDRIQVYSYHGVRLKEDPQAWIDAFLAPAEAPPPEPATEAMRSLLRFADRLL